jgi:hypothetical protein
MSNTQNIVKKVVTAKTTNKGIVGQRIISDMEEIFLFIVFSYSNNLISEISQASSVL